MNKEEVKTVIVAILQEIQEVSGRSMDNITEATRPLEDLKGFDSLNAVEASAYLSDSLGCDISPDLGLFVQGSRCRTVSEIADEVVKILSQSGKQKIDVVNHE